MKHISVEALKAAGHKDPVAAFKAIALAGGFGEVDPSHGGGLDLSGLDADKKADVDKILATKTTKPEPPSA